MKFQEVMNFAKKYSSVVLLNRILPSPLRIFVYTCSCIIFVVSSLFLLVNELYARYPLFVARYQSLSVVFSSHRNEVLVVALFSFLLFMLIYALHTYSRYFELRSIERVFEGNESRFRVTYEAALGLLASEKVGFMNGLLSVDDSRFVMNRLLVSPSDFKEYTSTVIVAVDQLVPLYNETVTVGSLWKVLYESNEELRKFFLSRKVQKEIYFDTCDWLDRMLEDSKRSSAWWWRENLSRTRGIGKVLSYGGTHFMSRYARELSASSGDVGNVVLHKDSVNALEEVLTKTHGANAVIVGEKGTGKHTIIQVLAARIDRGNCYSEIEHKRLFEFDNTILSSLSASELVTVLDRCFAEACVARNIIFVIHDVAAVFDIAQKQGVDLFQILERYITHPDVSVICTCEQSFYQREVHKVIFDKDFEVIHVESMQTRLLVPYIQDYAMLVEWQTGKFFPSHSIALIAAALTKYFVEDAPLVKAGNLLHKIAEHTTGDSVILDENSVSETIKALTGVATGDIQGDEKEKLLTLEETLHNNVMGQNEALKIVASTMRRSRAGLTSSSKPIGSFLFLGPTGVGKTETAKTLARVFFGDDGAMSRIDMNEYTMDNSSSRLLGNDSQEGDIAKLLHIRPYGVLLLDEFEKATSDVKDIFLRILDEGLFTNGAGKIISAKTQIVIATSNAGSTYIRQSGLSATSTKEEVESIKSKLIDVIVSEGLFRPELINRFDAVVVFHPLGDDSRMLIARKMLDALKERVLQQGYEVTFTDALVKKVLGNEGDVMFGGRAIQRNIQTEVEEAIAKKIIEGSLQVGGTVVLDADDIE